uniref:SAP domain-containing protein n=1 Tax=Solanum tuberosum TaxID=4113 RepID=M1B894_SOLTU
MEDTSSSIPPNNATTPGAAKYLAGLPSRGLFSSNVLSSTPDLVFSILIVEFCLPSVLGIYMLTKLPECEDQLIKTNQQNILIRSLMLKKQRGEYSSKDGKGISSNDNGRKRAAEKALDSRASAKKATTSNHAASAQETSKTHAPEIQNMTVEKLRALLKEKGLSLRGRKASIRITFLFYIGFEFFIVVHCYTFTR